eukprot:TRINITY_DN1711_c0_g2_i2.p1 TRINITY_DN1711_c0_g2~~TRINITY_DN1711_c0_g2_i2.p1  ORF type:complete len:200 (-),score=33.38 TRINITY_DN1711_c0_g2_i2:107-706(-)
MGTYFKGGQTIMIDPFSSVIDHTKHFKSILGFKWVPTLELSEADLSAIWKSGTVLNVFSFILSPFMQAEGSFYITSQIARIRVFSSVGNGEALPLQSKTVKISIPKLVTTENEIEGDRKLEAFTCMFLPVDGTSWTKEGCEYRGKSLHFYDCSCTLREGYYGVRMNEEVLKPLPPAQESKSLYLYISSVLALLSALMLA